MLRLRLRVCRAGKLARCKAGDHGREASRSVSKGHRKPPGLGRPDDTARCGEVGRQGIGARQGRCCWIKVFRTRYGRAALARALPTRVGEWAP
jgi:hypothetical protein